MGERNGATAWVVALLALALLIRLPRVLANDFPLNDGGIFYVMAGELAGARLTLPSFTSYNNARIPFAYPPLAIATAAAVNLATGADLLTVQRFLPLLASLVAVAVFFLLARRLAGSLARAGLATLLFVVLPRSYEWLIMGGGLTRSFGFVFLLLTLLFGHRLLAGRERRASFPAALFLGFAVLSHPEMGMLAAAAVGVLTVAAGIDRWKTVRAAEIAVGALILTAPWWATVIARHGLAPFTGAAGSSGFWLRGAVVRLASGDVSGEVGFPVIASLAALGFLLSLWRRDLIVPGWLVAAFVLVPRAAGTLATVPLALLATLGLADVVVPGMVLALGSGVPPLGGGSGPPIRLGGTDARARTLGVVMAGLAVLYPLAFSNAFRMTREWASMAALSRPERAAMAWVASNTPPASRFLLVSTASRWWVDPVDAWFPALTGRESVTSPNGAEWLPQGEFQKRETEYLALKACPVVDDACLEAWSRRFHETFTHLYISKPISAGAQPVLLRDGLQFRVVFEGAGATVLQRRQP